MAEKKPFLLRVDPKVLEAVRRWADDDLRSLNAQIEWILRDALVACGRVRRPPEDPRAGASRPRHPVD